MIFKAFGTIYRLIIARAERHFRSFSTFCTDHFEHLAGTVRTAKVAIFTFALMIATALGATAGITGKTFGTIKLLLTSCKDESLTTVTAS